MSSGISSSIPLNIPLNIPSNIHSDIPSDVPHRQPDITSRVYNKQLTSAQIDKVYLALQLEKWARSDQAYRISAGCTLESSILREEFVFEVERRFLVIFQTIFTGEVRAIYGQPPGTLDFDELRKAIERIGFASWPTHKGSKYKFRPVDGLINREVAAKTIFIDKWHKGPAPWIIAQKWGHTITVQYGIRGADFRLKAVL
ncbi:Uu.00g139260.m01.CDS01 [Anthostomella pinea]|uniref:Uu.00g139260.m01.CDS01 n=1 Tax=Anthostomella pinea TaxID=933095 RepID=A0AAI8YLE5_9PEZI|nr:Uu.00g139260.m01.CDS01 [Anthostomella pinea]